MNPHSPQTMIMEKVQRAGFFPDTHCFLLNPESTDPLFCAETELYFKPNSASDVTLRYGGSGESSERNDAEIASIAEAMESVCGDVLTNERLSTDLLISSQKDLKGRSIDLKTIGVFTEEQCAKNGYHLYRGENDVLGWVKGRSLTQDDDVFLPALSVFQDYSPRENERIPYPTTSNGMAANSALNKAILSGLYEVIERNAFLDSWLFKRSGKKVIYSTDNYCSRVIACLKNENKCVEQFQLQSAISCSVILSTIIERHSDGRKSLCVGLGTHHNPFLAAKKSLIEALRSTVNHTRERKNTKVAQRIRNLGNGNCSVESMEDHGYYYQNRESLDEIEFLDCGETIFIEDTESTCTLGVHNTIRSITEELGSNGYEAIFVNLTTELVRQAGFHVVRVVIPGFLPMYHGQNLIRISPQSLGTLGFSQKLSEVWANINHNPHPLG